MATLTVRKLPSEVHQALRIRAAECGHSMEAEVREILMQAVIPTESVKLGSFLYEVCKDIKLSDEEYALCFTRNSPPVRGVDFD